MKVKLLTMGVTVLLIAITFSGCFEETKKTTPVKSKTIYVYDGGGKDYTSIRDAINSASDGDTVFVYNGTYLGNVTVNKSINLIGEDKETTVIYGYVKVIANLVNISSFTIFTIKDIVPIYGPPDPADEILTFCAGIIINANNTTVQGNILTENTLGIYLGYSFNNKITANVITNNSEGIYLIRSSQNIIEKNEITNNNRIFQTLYRFNNDGISMRNAYNNTITNNTISNNLGAGIILYRLCENNTIYYNNFINNSQNANDTGNNSWDNSERGNYWDDYTGSDNNGDEIGDTPYNILGGNKQDRYPLMNQYQQ